MVRIFSVDRMKALGLSRDTPITGGLERTIAWFARKCVGRGKWAEVLSFAIDRDHELVEGLASCVVCGGQRLPFPVPTTDALTICRKCRHISWMRTPTSEELAAYYQADYAEAHNQPSIQEESRAYYRSHLKYLAGHVPRAWRPILVDYGCAWPALLEEARVMDAFGTLYGVEWDTASCARGRACGIEMVRPDMVDDAIPDRSVDIVRFSHVLEHTINPVNVFKVMARKLKPGGIVYITQPTFPVFGTKTPPQRIKDANYPSHLQFFNPLSISRVVQSGGLKCIEFGAHSSHHELMELYEACIDENYSRKQGRHLRGLTPRYFDSRGGFPNFVGDNVHLVARKS